MSLEVAEEFPLCIERHIVSIVMLIAQQSVIDRILERIDAQNDLDIPDFIIVGVQNQEAAPSAFPFILE